MAAGLRSDGRGGRLIAYFLFLLAGAAVGVDVALGFLSANAGACAGADAAGNCVMQQLAAPALTRFALVLVCAHGLAALVLDVVPDVRRKVRAGYRLRQEPKPAPMALGPAGEPVSALAAACWAPVQRPRRQPVHASPVRASLRAVCPSCVTVVVAHQGACPDCRAPVVARRG